LILIIYDFIIISDSNSIKTMISIPKWTYLAKIQHISMIQTMYIWMFIVPIIAKVLTKVEETANLTIFSHTFNVQLGLPFSWKIFFLSAMSFAIANLLFVLRCYKLVKDHNSFSDFLEQGKNAKHIHQYAEAVNFPLKRDLSYNWEEWEGSEVTALSERIQDVKSSGEHLKQPFWDIYEKTDSSRKGWRVTCSLLYLFGFVLISIVLCQNIWVVLRMTF